MPPWLQRLWIQLTADRKRFGLLCTALAVGLLLWARLIILTNVPRTAVADKEAQASAERRGAGGADSARGSRSTDDFRGDGPLSAAHVRLWLRPRRDPFIISDEHFPNLPSEAPSSDEQAKSAADHAEDEQRAEARLRARLRQEVDRFILEAVMLGGTTPMAVINNRTWQLGDEIAAMAEHDLRFTLVEVAPRRVVLEHHGRRFELAMHTPGD